MEQQTTRDAGDRENKRSLKNSLYHDRSYSGRADSQIFCAQRKVDIEESWSEPATYVSIHFCRRRKQELLLDLQPEPSASESLREAEDLGGPLQTETRR